MRCTLLLNELIDILLSRSLSVICNLFVFKYRNSFFRLLAFHGLVLDELSFGIDDENLIFQYSNCTVNLFIRVVAIEVIFLKELVINDMYRKYININ